MYEALGGTQASDNDVILKNYLAQQDPKNPAKCWTKAGFTPRRLAGSHDKKNTGRIVWGESCDGWRHFDCIGLVEFAVQQAVKITIGGEIWQFASPKNVLHAKQIHDDRDIMNGDLVSQVNSDGTYHHIGVIYLVEGGGAMIAQAVETSMGVTVGTTYNRSSWSGGRWRLPDSLLKPDSEISEEIPDSKYRPTIPLPQYD